MLTGEQADRLHDLAEKLSDATREYAEARAVKRALNAMSTDVSPNDQMMVNGIEDKFRDRYRRACREMRVAIREMTERTAPQGEST